MFSPFNLDAIKLCIVLYSTIEQFSKVKRVYSAPGSPKPINPGYGPAVNYKE